MHLGIEKKIAASAAACTLDVRRILRGVGAGNARIPLIAL
jgi:hypothetical protein